jgi:hypothetical protein
LALLGGVVTVAATERYPWLVDRPGLSTLLGGTAATALLAALTARARTEHRTDPGAERRLRFWSGFPGRWLFALARLGLAYRAPPAPGRSAVMAMTPARPTP